MQFESESALKKRKRLDGDACAELQKTLERIKFSSSMCPFLIIITFLSQHTCATNFKEFVNYLLLGL